MLKADSYFDLGGFEFADLFEEDTPVWQVIERLENYVALLFGHRRVERITRRLQREYLENLVMIERNVSIGWGTRICSGAFIGNDVVIGKNCLIKENATLKGPLILGDGCVVGECGVVVASVFLPGAAAAQQSSVSHSILGRGVNLEAGVKTATGCVFTGLREFGVVVGDGCSIGCNTVLNPGAFLGKDCRVGPLVAVPNRLFPTGD